MAEERFDIYDEELNPLGTATRAETHALGYWHRTFHCWLTRREGSRQLVRFQRRQLGKDTNPGCWDITVAGHLSAGETLREGVRELREEIGVTASYDELVHLFQVREDASGIVNGLPFIDREVSDVYALVCDLPLEALRLQPEEVAGVYEAELGELLGLFRGEREALEARGVELAAGTVGDELARVAPPFPSSAPSYRLEPCIRTVRAENFVPRPIEYYIDVLTGLRGLSLS